MMTVGSHDASQQPDGAAIPIAGLAGADPGSPTDPMPSPDSAESHLLGLHGRDEILLLRSDLGGRILYVSADLQARFGGDVTGRDRAGLMHPDVPEWYRKRIDAALRAGIPWAGPVKLRGQDGSERWFYGEAQALSEEAGGGTVERYSDLSGPERQKAEQLFSLASDPEHSLRERARRGFTVVSTIRGRMRIVLFLGIGYLLFASAFIGLSYVAIRYFTGESARIVQNIRTLDLHYNDHMRRWMTVMNPGTKRAQFAALEKEIQDADTAIRAEQAHLREDIEAAGTGESGLKLMSEIEEQYGSLSGAVMQALKDRRESDDVESIAQNGMQYRIMGAMQQAHAGLLTMQRRQGEIQGGAAEIEGMLNEQEAALRGALDPAGANREAMATNASAKALEIRSRVRSLRASASAENPGEQAQALEEASRQFRELMGLFANSLGGNQVAADDGEGSYEKRLGKRTDALVRLVEEQLRSKIRVAEIIHIIGIIGTLGIGLIILLGLPAFVARTFLSPMEEVQHVAERMADGDVSARLETRGQDEVSLVFEAMRAMNIRLRGLISQIQDSSRVSAESSLKISEHATSLSGLAQEQAVATEEASAAVEQLTSAADIVERTIREQAIELARNKEVSDSLSAEAETMHQGMVQLKSLARDSSAQAASGESTINLAAEAMTVIRSQSDRIGEIVTLIRDISDQTHLLSLNASIEAARAGDEGRGFAVVASEISRLADRTAESVKEIDRLIRMTGDAVRRGSDQFTTAATNFKDIIVGVGRIDSASDLLLKVVSEQAAKASSMGRSAAHVSGLAADVDQAAREQKKAMGEVNQNIQGISQRSQSVGEAALDLSTLVHELADQAEILRSLIERFRLR